MGFYEEILADLKKKLFQIDQKSWKNQKLTVFDIFNVFLSKIRNHS